MTTLATRIFAIVLIVGAAWRLIINARQAIATNDQFTVRVYDVKDLAERLIVPEDVEPRPILLFPPTDEDRIAELTKDIGHLVTAKYSVFEDGAATVDHAGGILVVYCPQAVHLEIESTLRQFRACERLVPWTTNR